MYTFYASGAVDDSCRRGARFARANFAVIARVTGRDVGGGRRIP